MNKLKRKDLPVSDCIVNEYFKDATHHDHVIREYCKKNCQHRCLRGLDYKKRDDNN